MGARQSLVSLIAVRRWLPEILFTAVYIGIIAYFSRVDVYHLHFFEPHYSLFYALFRTAFAFYLFWMAACSGLAVFWLIGAHGSIQGAPKYAAGFFAGAAAWTLLMLLLGYLGLYTRTIAFLVTVPVVAASSRHFHQTMRVLFAYLRKLRRRNIAIFALATIAIVFGLLLMMVKGLYPAGGHDYFTHYHYYLLSVLKHQDLWPNEVWYHYYYDKAMGLFFLAMLLTDPLAPSLATACFVAATGIALFDLVR
jgi:hypothetical protein